MLNKKLLFQANLYTILDIVTQGIPLTETFEKVLDTLFEIDTIKVEKKGLVFLKNEKGLLKLKAHRNVGVLKTMCATVNPGQCLCGKVMLEKETFFCNSSVTHDYTNQHGTHGHYILPIKSGGTVLGILCLYTQAGVEKDADTLNYLETVATILANKTKKEYQKAQLESVAKQLVISESKYRDMIENSNDVICQSNYKGDFIYANKATQELTGYSIDEFLTFNFVDIIVEEHKERVVKFYANNLKETTSNIGDDIEFPMICKNGTVKWVDQRVSVVFEDNSKKRIKHFQVIARDITSKKLMEEELIKIHKKTKELVVITSELNETLEEKVEARTKEIELQKIMLEKNYATAKILAQMGLDISSSLNFDEIFNKLYQNVNKLLDAEVFGVRIYNREENVIEYKYDIESGVVGDVIHIPFSDKDNYTVWCIEHNKEILINDNEKEYKNYVSEIRVPSGKMPHSLIFCPMIVGNTVLGAITVQSFKKNAYTKNDVDIIRTLSFYTGIALANAQLYESLEFKVAGRTLELSRKNKEITDSINYTKRIQYAMFINNEDREKLLPDSFVFHQSKDVLSGDFYRVDEIKTNSGVNLFSFIVGDCTGHGVPGAILAVLCNSILKHSITNSKINSPSEALDYAKNQLELLFQNAEGEIIDDGMDVAFCALNKETNVLYFAGANSNCIIVRKEEVLVLKGDRKPVGHQDDETLFTNHTFQLEKNDCVYLTSDGIVDQFGGPKNRKFMRKRFFELLQRESLNPMNIQRENIKKEFDNWKGKTEQTDDVCVLGVRIT